MRERDIEAYLVTKVRKAGGVAYKFVSPGRAGVPDRLCVFPGGAVCFVELKAPGCEPTAIQYAQISRLQRLGCRVHIIYDKEQVDPLVGMYR